MSTSMGFVKKMKQHFKSEMDDVFSEQIKFGLFSLNFLVVGGTFGFQCYDAVFKESTKETVQLTIKQFKKDHQRKEILPEWISLWASKDDDKLIRRSLKLIHKVIEEDPDEFVNRKKGFSRMIEPWITKDYVQKKGLYTKMWTKFGNAIKFGIVKSEANRNEFANFLRFESTKSEGELISLDEYLSRLQSGQNKIFYLIATKNQLEKSPFIEMLKKKDFEVILLTDDIDPYVVQHLLAYKGKTFHDICQDGFKFYKEDLEKSFEKLVQWWTKLLDVDVKINHLLSYTPCVVVESRYGLTSFLEILPHSEPHMPARRVLEINPGDPMIKDLCQHDPKDENVQRLAIALYGIALIESGLLLTESETSTFHPFRFAQSSLNRFGGVKKEPEIEIGKNFFEKVFPLPWSRSSRTP
ncbi:endoplasmin homolog [Solanum tuberosum]|uniref:endoplasmin homolog n=1 Tax=Solanum tuberosum TaxID=4113 RepID=UPI00073A204D|nr:PREDICTED: endoplasmin homolog [Solanum tuberosum]